MTSAPDHAPQLVSIVIVNYNGATLLKPCLESVFAQPYRPIEVLVVDNASVDESVEMVRNRFPEVHLIINGVNKGFAEANNQGVSSAAGDLIVLLNNDTIVDQSWLRALLQAFCRPGVAVAGSKIVTRGIPTEYYEMNGTVNYLGYNIMRVFSDLSQVFYAGGASLMFSKRAVGTPFLSEYFLYQEDLFLSWRMRLRGGSIRMAQDSIVHHVGSATTARHSLKFVTFYQERNRLLNALLFYQFRTLVRLFPFFFADAAAKFAAALFGKGKSFVGLVRAYGWIVLHPRWIGRRRRELQRERTIGDREIMGWMSSKVLQGDGVLPSVANALSSAYARIVGLASHD